MENHVKFLPGEQKKFLFQVAEKSSLSVDCLAELAGITPRSFRDWKRGKINMSLSAARVFCDKFKIVLPEDEATLLKRWFKAREEASRKGAINRNQKYGNFGTLEGRRKGGKKALQILRKKGVIPLAKNFTCPKSFSRQLAEFVGILLGDGGLTPMQVQITLNSVADKNYVPFVYSLGESLFGEAPSITTRQNCDATTVYFSGVKLVNYLISIGLKTGNKVKQQVGVPGWIKQNRDYRLSCLRGLVDTDGGVFLHRYRVGGKIYSYKKINFSNRSHPLILFVAEVLKEIGLTPKVCEKLETMRVWLYNKDEVEKYLMIVGTSNPRLLRYQDW